jgi:hypothetical protein
MARGSTKDAGTSMRLPEPVWAHGGIQLVMYTLPLPHTLEHTPARNFALWRTLKTKKRANKPKRSCQTLYPSHYPQLTKLEQIGQSIVQPIILLFGSYFGPRGWELFHIRICVDYAKQNSGNRVFCDRNHMTRAPKSAYRLWGEFHRGKNDQVYQAVPRSRDPRLFFFHSMGQAR